MQADLSLPWSQSYSRFCCALAHMGMCKYLQKRIYNFFQNLVIYAEYSFRHIPEVDISRDSPWWNATLVTGLYV